MPHTSADWYWLRARISGTSAVRGQIRLWKDGSAEPAGWLIDETDASPPAGLQGAGHTGIRFLVPFCQNRLRHRLLEKR